MTFLVERVATLRRHLDHLRQLQPQVTATALRDDLSLRNNVMFSLLVICQRVIDVASELSSRRGDRFESYTDAMGNLTRDARFPSELVDKLAQLPGFRNVLVHESISVDYDRVIEALDNLQPVEQFMEIVGGDIK